MDYVLGLSYEPNFPIVLFGGTGKFISQSITTSASSFAGDLGLIYKTQSDKVRIGSISNFGSDMVMDGKIFIKRLILTPWVIPVIMRPGRKTQEILGHYPSFRAGVSLSW